jgi:hypothetical protein
MSWHDPVGMALDGAVALIDDDEIEELGRHLSE